MSPWILTAGGRMVDLQYVDHQALQLRDIAHALAQINRFTGHARRPYSVAEHSLLVLEIVERLMPEVDAHGRHLALMHDAHEAYIGDVSSPLKCMLRNDWPMLDERLQSSVRSAYGLHTAAFNWSALVKAADLIALATERQQLMHPAGAMWEVLLHVQPVEWVDLMSRERCAMTWADWRDRFEDEAEARDFAWNA